MEHCEYRISVDEARENFWSKKKRGAVIAVATSENALVCQVKLNELYSNPICELPGFPTERCPIAQYYKGELTFDQANQDLREIFNSQK